MIIIILITISSFLYIALILKTLSALQINTELLLNVKKSNYDFFVKHIKTNGL